MEPRTDRGIRIAQLPVVPVTYDDRIQHLPERANPVDPSSSPPPAPARVAAFFALTFLWSWGFWGLAILSSRPWTELPTVVFYVAGGVGPSVVAWILAYVVPGGGSPPLWRRLVDVRRIRPRWWLAIVLVAFVPSLVGVLGPGSWGASVDDGGAPFGAPILLVAVLAALAEEPGWRGYALDGLLAARGALTASLLVGLGWTLWHLPFYFISGTVQQEAGMASLDFWVDMGSRLPLAVVFAWLYVNTDRSVLSAVALHALDNVASVVIGPEGVESVVRLGVVTLIAVVVTVHPRHGLLRVASEGEVP